MPRAARNRRQATRPAPSAMRHSQRNIWPPARLINPATSLDAAAVSSTATSTIVSSVMAVGITAPSAAPPPFQLSHDGALAALLGATAGQMPAYRGRWHLSFIIVYGPLGVGAPAPEQDRPRDVFAPTSLSIDCRVPAKLKAKIWAHEYFDFGLLLANSPTEPQYHLSVTTSAAYGSAGLPTLCLEPTNKAKPLTSVDAWTSAFQIFVGVYTTKFPQEAPALMKYGEVVRDLAARGGNWRYYDTNFRYLKQQQPASLAWNVVHWELWIRSQNLSTTKPPRPSNGGGGG